MLWMMFLAGLPMIEDDYPRAAAQAKAQNKPIVVDFWATWCHSCLNMKAYVFTDPTVARLASDAVFVSIDTEKDKNAAIVQRFTPQVWPTLLIIDPSDKHVLGRLAASATAPEFVAFVKSATTAPAALREADALAADGNTHAAAAKYREALKGAQGSVLGRAAYGLTMAQSQEGDYAACAETAQTYAGKLASSYFGPSLLAMHADCLMQQDKPADALAPAIQKAIDTLALNVDDKSDLYATLAEIAEARGQAAERTRLLQVRVKLLEDAAKSAPTPEAARVFDAHRTDTYLALDQPDAAIAMLIASEAAAPTDYNPSARLARAYLAKGDVTHAKAAIARAKQRVYGPRAAVVALLEADILLKSGDTAGARAAYRAAKATLEKQTPSAGVKRRLQDIDKKLQALPSAG